MKWILFLSLLLVGCETRVDRDMYFQEVKETTDYMGNRRVRIRTADLETEAEDRVHGFSLKCWNIHGDVLPKEGLDEVTTAESGDPPGLFEKMKSAMTAQPVPTPQQRNYYEVTFWPFHFSDPYNVGTSPEEAEEYETGRLLVESGIYKDCTCRVTVYWIEPGDTIQPDGDWDTRLWHELEHIEF